MKSFRIFLETFPNQFTAWLVILSTLLFGYITGLNISHTILDAPKSSVPVSDDGESVTVSIPASYLKITQPPKLVYKQVKQAAN